MDAGVVIHPIACMDRLNWSKGREWSDLAKRKKIERATIDRSTKGSSPNFRPVTPNVTRPSVLAISLSKFAKRRGRVMFTIVSNRFLIDGVYQKLVQWHVESGGFSGSEST